MELRPNVSEVAIDDYTNPEHSNTVKYFGYFSKEDITREAGKLLMLDIDFGRDCSLRCPGCFRRKNVVDDSHDPDLTYEELLEVIDDARKLGLREIKICGAGEPFENSDLIRFARQLTEWDIGLSIFTKGHVLGDDELTSNIFSSEGINDTLSLTTVMFQLKTSILVSFQSYKSEIQDKLVGNVKGFTNRRNRAIETLAEVGFNKCLPTRLALCATPMMRDTYNEILDFYVYCRKRNIFPLITTFMTSGKQLDRRFLLHFDVTDEEKIQIYTKIYKYNITNGIQTLQEIEDEGISPMPGVHPCNQIATGLYITCNGNAVSCPGNCSDILGNVHDTSISDIWFGSDNFKRRGIYNCKCPPKEGYTIPFNLFSEVIIRLNRF